jgi:hypothetical protein
MSLSKPASSLALASTSKVAAPAVTKPTNDWGDWNSKAADDDNDDDWGPVANDDDTSIPVLDSKSTNGGDDDDYAHGSSSVRMAGYDLRTHATNASSNKATTADDADWSGGWGDDDALDNIPDVSAPSAKPATALKASTSGWGMRLSWGGGEEEEAEIG